MMTVQEIKEHADRLQDRLDAERHKVLRGEYRGSPEANLALIAALDGRITELKAQCAALEAAPAPALA